MKKIFVFFIFIIFNIILLKSVNAQQYETDTIKSEIPIDEVSKINQDDEKIIVLNIIKNSQEKQKKEVWYEKDIIETLFVVFITNMVTILAIYIQSNRQTKSKIHLNQIEYISEQLSDFYDPLFSLLKSNDSIFKKLGPQNFRTNFIEREADTEIWLHVKESVIIPNNNKIKQLISDKCYLISENDSIDEYIKLNEHIIMYKIFTEYPTEKYKDFFYPDDILDHVENIRNEILNKINNMKKGKS